MLSTVTGKSKQVIARELKIVKGFTEEQRKVLGQVELHSDGHASYPGADEGRHGQETGDREPGCKRDEREGGDQDGVRPGKKPCHSGLRGRR